MKKKTKTMLIAGVIVLIIIVGVLWFFIGFKEETTAKEGDIKLISVEPIGGKYNVSILHEQNYFEGKWHDNTEIRYTKNGREYQGYYLPLMKEALDWIKTNTSENCTVLSWWDYGIMLEGYVERNIIAKFPSLAIKHTIHFWKVFDEEAKKKFIEEHEWTSNETIQELVMMLTATNISSNESKEIMQKYNVSYIFTYSYDKIIAWIFFNATGKNPDEYVNQENYFQPIPTDKGNETLIYKMWSDNPEIPGLELVYDQNLEDSVYGGNIVRIFKFV